MRSLDEGSNGCQTRLYGSMEDQVEFLMKLHEDQAKFCRGVYYAGDLIEGDLLEDGYTCWICGFMDSDEINQKRCRYGYAWFK